ncbi:MAG TPA: type II CAAX endopeptidase family protein [Candidatus Eisenbacteria bacterium]
MSVARIFLRAPREPGEAFGRRLRAGWKLLIFAVLGESLSAFAFTCIRLALRLTAPPGMSAGLLSLGEMVQFGIALLVTLLMARLERRPFGTYGLAGRRAAGRMFWVGSLWGFLAVAALIGLIVAARGASIGGLAIHGADLARYLVLWTIAFIGVGLYEETYFRGYALYTLTTGMGFWPGAILLSALFGAIHFFLKPMENVFDLASVSLLGLFLCLTLRRTGSLWFGIGFHFAFDWAALFVFGAPNTANEGKSVAGRLLDVHYTGPPWLTGGPLGIEASVMVFVVIAALYLLFNARYREKRWPAEEAGTPAS